MLPGQENAATEPLQPVKSGRSRKTPQPELPPQRSSRRTPKPDRTQLQRSLRKTTANGVTKRRGRPANRATADEPEDLSTSRGTQAEEEAITTRKRKSGKAQKLPGDHVVSTASEVQGDRPGTPEAAPSAVPSSGVKKRKKRKSIGQQSTSRAKAAKARSSLKPGRQPRKRMPKSDFAETIEATDLEGSSAKEVQKETLVDVVPLDGGEPAHLPEVAEILDPEADSVEPSAEKPQQVIAEKPRKRKRVAGEELPKKRVKGSSTQSKRGAKAPKTQTETVPAEDAVNAVQSIEKPAKVAATSPGDANEKQEFASKVPEPRQEKPKKRKRVTVGQQSKKRAKVGVTRTDRDSRDQEETSTADNVLEENQSVGKPAEVAIGPTSQIDGELEATAEEPVPQTHKPKRKKRKSIGQQKPKRKSTDLAAPNKTAGKTAARSPMATKDGLSNKPAAKRGRPRAKQPLEEAIEESQAEKLPEEQMQIQHLEPGLKSKPKARRGRPKPRPISEDIVEGPNEEPRGRASEEEDEVQAPILPGKKKRGRPHKADAAQPTSKTSRPTKTLSSRKPKAKAASSTTTTAPTARAPPKNSVPITVYALPSPTSSDAEDDPLSTSQPHTTTTTINAVDVLSQLCSELLSKSSSALAEQARSEPSATEPKHTKQTTDLYAKELASRLLQLTTTLNANSSLQSRVKAAAKEERGLKKELKQLEKEREELRTRKEEVLKERKKRELEDLLSGIAGAVKRGWDMQEEGDAVAGMVEEVDLEI